MKKDKEWLKNEVLNLRSVSRGVMILSIGEVMELIYQLDEPEKIVIPQFVAEAFEKAKESNFYAEQLITAMYDSSDEVAYWLEVPSNEKLLLRAWLNGYKVKELPVIPRFVADWWERDDDSVTMYGRLRVEKKHKFDLISIFYDKGLGDYLSKVEDWIYENDSAFLDLVNGKPYEVEEEQKYYTLDFEDIPLLERWGNQIQRTTTELSIYEKGRDNSRFELTEQEIKDYDERYWPFAVEVEE